MGGSPSCSGPACPGRWLPTDWPPCVQKVRAYGDDLLSADDFQKLFNEFDKSVTKEVTGQARVPCSGPGLPGVCGDVCVSEGMTPGRLGARSQGGPAQDAGPKAGPWERDGWLLGPGLAALMKSTGNLQKGFPVSTSSRPFPTSCGRFPSRPALVFVPTPTYRVTSLGVCRGFLGQVGVLAGRRAGPLFQGWARRDGAGQRWEPVSAGRTPHACECPCGSAPLPWPMPPPRG